MCELWRRDCAATMEHRRPQTRVPDEPFRQPNQRAAILLDRLSNRYISRFVSKRIKLHDFQSACGDLGRKKAAYLAAFSDSLADLSLRSVCLQGKPSADVSGMDVAAFLELLPRSGGCARG